MLRSSPGPLLGLAMATISTLDAASITSATPSGRHRRGRYNQDQQSQPLRSQRRRALGCPRTRFRRRWRSVGRIPSTPAIRLSASRIATRRREPCLAPGHPACLMRFPAVHVPRSSTTGVAGRSQRIVATARTSIARWPRWIWPRISPAARTEEPRPTHDAARSHRGGALGLSMRRRPSIGSQRAASALGAYPAGRTIVFTASGPGSLPLRVGAVAARPAPSDHWDTTTPEPPRHRLRPRARPRRRLNRQFGSALGTLRPLPGVPSSVLMPSRRCRRRESWTTLRLGKTTSLIMSIHATKSGDRGFVNGTISMAVATGRSKDPAC